MKIILFLSGISFISGITIIPNNYTVSLTFNGLSWRSISITAFAEESCTFGFYKHSNGDTYYNFCQSLPKCGISWSERNGNTFHFGTLVNETTLFKYRYKYCYVGYWNSGSCYTINQDWFVYVPCKNCSEEFPAPIPVSTTVTFSTAFSFPTVLPCGIPTSTPLSKGSVIPRNTPLPTPNCGVTIPCK